MDGIFEAWLWWRKTTVIERLVMAGVVLCVVALVLGSASGTPVEQDRMVCLSRGGVPIMNHDRDQMIGCSLPGVMR